MIFGPPYCTLPLPIPLHLAPILSLPMPRILARALLLPMPLNLGLALLLPINLAMALASVHAHESCSCTQFFFLTVRYLVTLLWLFQWFYMLGLITDPVQKTAKKLLRSIFFNCHFFQGGSGDLFRHLIINLVSFITFEQIKLEWWWVWAHMKDPFKSFPNVNKFM